VTLLGRLTLLDFPQPEVARCLSPNGRSSWFVRHKVRVRVEERVWAEAKRQELPKMRGLVVMRPTLVYPVARKRDDDNAATGVMKVVRDVLAKGGWIETDDTDHLRQEPVEIRVTKGVRMLVLEFSA
jgi:hypothetical protein